MQGAVRRPGEECLLEESRNRYEPQIADAKLFQGNLKRSVAAGRRVGSNQHQLRPGLFRLRSATKAGEDSENGHVCGEDPEADRRKNCEAEDEGHKERVHR